MKPVKQKDIDLNTPTKNKTSKLKFENKSQKILRNHITKQKIKKLKENITNKSFSKKEFVFKNNCIFCYISI